MVETIETTSRLNKVDTIRLRGRSIKSEAYSRRMNLRFKGVIMGPNETNVHCRNMIYATLNKEMGIIDVQEKIIIEKCHRDSPGGHSGTEGGCTRITYFAEEGVFF